MSKKLFTSGLVEADLKLRGVPEGMPSVSFPFAAYGDISTKVISQKYRSFAPCNRWGLDARIDTETALSAGVNADDYFVVEESEPIAVCSGVVEVERTFATLPQPHVDYESQVVTYPSLSSAFYSEEYATPACLFNRYDYTTKYGIFYIGREYAGQKAKVFYKYTQSLSNSSNTSEGWCLLTIDANGFIAFFSSPYATTLSSAGERSFGVWSNGFGNLYWEITSVNVYDYYMDKRAAICGQGKTIVDSVFYKISNSADFLKIEFTPPYMDDWSKSLSANSSPTLAEYANAVRFQQPVVYGFPILSRWKGNIFEMRTSRVVPQ